MLIRRGLGLLLVVGLLLSVGACGGGAGGRTAVQTGGQSADNLASFFDDFLRWFRGGSADDLVEGNADEVADVLRTHSDEVDNALAVPAIQTQIDDAALAAEPVVRSKVQQLFSDFEPTLQTQIDRKLRSMICQARLSVQNPTGDQELFRTWILQEFQSIGVQLGQYDLDEIAVWLGERISDTVTVNSLACILWARSGS